MSGPESKIVKQITRWLDTLKPECKYMKIHGSVFQERGTPDLLIILNGDAFFLEVKVPGKHATEIQLYRMAEWGAAGVTVATVRSLDEAQQVVRPLGGGTI